MSENAQPIFAIEKLYIKDLSVEAPNTPQIFLERDTPNVNVQLRTDTQKVDDGIYEVVLTITVSSTLAEDKTVFLVEVAQAGVFQIRNVAEEELEPIMMVGCANILFPYAREAISDAITRTGFQPVVLAPVNFELLYQQQLEHIQANATTDSSATIQ